MVGRPEGSVGRLQRWRSAVFPLAVAASFLISCAPVAAEPSSALTKPPVTVGRICDLIAIYADMNRLPRDFFARLIWKESRFDPNAVSPVGAEGIAQFMPGTAKMRGLADSFDIDQAIPASALYLSELRTGFGNLGLAAAAYNSGETRVSRWLSSGGFLPLETEEYVLDVLGEPADNFADRAYQGTVRPLDAKLTFAEACRSMRRILADTVAMSSVVIKPWGVQVAGNFRRSAAIRQWQRVATRVRSIEKDAEPVVSRVRTARGRRGIYAVRIGADGRAEADAICRKLRAAGGSCVVLRNR
ncbi:MAG: lytic transglycosylase domain-containing protein [Rhizobiaceae bacterium]|nr:lytic transglycosylase domain-containing protein [Rhizobiaceae bacterium]